MFYHLHWELSSEISCSLFGLAPSLAWSQGPNKSRTSVKAKANLSNQIIDYTILTSMLTGVLHLQPKISMFCALSQNNQQLFEK